MLAWKPIPPWWEINAAKPVNGKYIILCIELIGKDQLPDDFIRQPIFVIGLDRNLFSSKIIDPSEIHKMILSRQSLKEVGSNITIEGIINFTVQECVYLKDTQVIEIKDLAMPCIVQLTEVKQFIASPLRIRQTGIQCQKYHRCAPPSQGRKGRKLSQDLKYLYTRFRKRGCVYECKWIEIEIPWSWYTCRKSHGS